MTWHKVTIVFTFGDSPMTSQLDYFTTKFLETRNTFAEKTEWSKIHG